MASDTAFTARWDRRLRLTARIYVSVTIAVPLIVIYAGYRSPAHPPVWIPALIMGVIFLIIIGISALLAPVGYQVQQDGVHIRRRIGKIVIPFATISAVQFHAGNEALLHVEKVMGNSGLCGYYGYFHSPSLRNFLAYATRREDVVVLKRTKEEPVVITPSEPERFTALVQQRLDGNSGKLAVGSEQ